MLVTRKDGTAGRKLAADCRGVDVSQSGRSRQALVSPQSGETATSEGIPERESGAQ